MGLHTRVALLACTLLAGCGSDGKEPDSPDSAAAVVVNGEPLAPQEIADLERTYGVEAVPGEYWYDSRTGQFGAFGGPCAGQLRPGHDFAPLPADASHGDSGVFLNGRELQDAEVLYVSWFTGAVAPGRYWMDAFGNVGDEGSPLVHLNLYALMTQHAAAGGGAPTGGGDSFWSSRYASGNSSSDGSGYVHIPSTTGGSGTFVSY